MPSDGALRAVVGLLSGSAVTAALLVGCTAHPSGVGPAATGPPATSQPPVDSNPSNDLSGNQTFVAYTAADGSFTVKVPKGWAQTSNGNDVLFSNKFSSIVLAPRSGFYHPTLEYAQAVELPDIAKHTAGFAASQVRMVDRPAGRVVLISYQADASPSPVFEGSMRQTVDRYEFTQPGSGRQVVLTLTAPAGSDHVDPWRAITESFTWLR